jgi:Cupin domain
MEDRRTFMALAAALFPTSLITLSAQAQPAAPTASGPRGDLARHTLTGPLADFDVVLQELHPPVGDGREHRHTGPVLGYVLEGKVKFAVNHEPARIYGVGEIFFEETGALHSTWGSVEGSLARVLAFMVVPKGSNGAAPRA